MVSGTETAKEGGVSTIRHETERVESEGWDDRTQESRFKGLSH